MSEVVQSPSVGYGVWGKPVGGALVCFVKTAFPAPESGVFTFSDEFKARDYAAELLEKLGVCVRVEGMWKVSADLSPVATKFWSGQKWNSRILARSFECTSDLLVCVQDQLRSFEGDQFKVVPIYPQY